MENIDIAALVREALLENKCDPSLLGDFDSHSTITLDFKDSPSILVSKIQREDEHGNANGEDEIWVWARIEHVSPHVFEQCAGKCLCELGQNCPFTQSRQLQINYVEDQEVVELKAHIHVDYLQNGQEFAKVLSQFFDDIAKFVGIYQG
ncbi:SPI-1 type III secretion system chaperone SpaK [Candidatus Fukatsuia symbiotica]|uniref:Uncharacterized protein n=1 Tax=Candidatus Fukatsuia symbiotica TaxID=1878942 RepID=A0A2U8I5B4_9GAMM|nr:hypothetical protein [Candidatus Fukatsuia symbiotica]AWK14310.1 hypothetical protein CCS41_07230 [Candidatus Fukatsuia symbiotica]MEA9444566.1 SPI-1 type III secretion system chaperone SpaK [Candidatus Fukatsuia symbiotica]